MMAVNINHFLNGICDPLDSTIDMLIQENIVPHDQLLDSSFFDSLSPQDWYQAYKMCILTYIVSKWVIIPQELQLLAAPAKINGLDIEIHSGTGSGKNLITALPIILDPTH